MTVVCPMRNSDNMTIGKAHPTLKTFVFNFETILLDLLRNQ